MINDITRHCFQMDFGFSSAVSFRRSRSGRSSRGRLWWTGSNCEVRSKAELSSDATQHCSCSVSSDLNLPFDVRCFVDRKMQCPDPIYRSCKSCSVFVSKFAVGDVADCHLILSEAACEIYDNFSKHLSPARLLWSSLWNVDFCSASYDGVDDVCCRGRATLPPIVST